MGPLDGVRVVDVTSGPGRSAGQILAGLGADVVRLAQGDAGADLPGGGAVLSWWFDSSTRRLDLDLDTEEGAAAFRSLVARADLLIEAEAPGSMSEAGLGPAALRALNPALVHVSVTPFGSDGPRAGWQSSDLVAQALGGWLSVTGDPDHPVSLWGRQAWNLAGMYAAMEGLAGVLRARRHRSGAWIDLSMHQAVVSCTEHLLMYWWYPEILAPYGAPIAARQRSLHWVRAYEVVACRRGHCMVSPAAGGLVGLIGWLHERGFAADVPADPAPDALLGLIGPMMVALREAALADDATELFLAGQSLHVPFGEVYSVAQVAMCDQHDARRFFPPVAGAEDVRLLGPLGRFSATPAGGPTPPRSGTDLDTMLDSWPARRSPAAGAAAPTPEPSGSVGTSADLPLHGVRVLDFTHVLAGPFATRQLADLGADVIRVQTVERAAGAGANEFPYNVLWARNKRSIQLDMHHGEAIGVLRRLVEAADVVVDNFSAGVMARWGASPQQLAEWNPRIITMAMSGCGAGGPWEHFVTYAPTVHALSGFTALTGPEGDDGCGPGVAYNDHVSGVVGATLLVSALIDRERRGVGQHIDVSQLEISTWLCGPAIVEYLATGHERRSAGNRDPWRDHVINDVFPCADGEWLAVTVPEPAQLAALASVVGDLDDDALRAVRRWAAISPDAAAAAAALQQADIAAGLVQNARHFSEADPQLAARDWLVEMESLMLGSQRTDRHPARWYGPHGELELTYRASPYLGQHNFDVYSELLGWDEAAVAEAMGHGLFS